MDNSHSRNRKNKIVFSIILGGMILLLASCHSRSKYSFSEGIVWNTAYHITYSGPDSIGKYFKPLLDSIGKSVSVFDSASLVSKLNFSDSCVADKALSDIYQVSKRVYDESDGMFDPTLSHLITAWGFGQGHTPTSDTLRLDSLLAITGLEKTYIEKDVIHKLHPNIQFNFSALAKGYGCDMVGEWLLKHGIENYLVEIGGEIVCRGLNEKGKSWRVSIDRPTPAVGSYNGLSTMVLEVSNCGIATSGNYRNYHESGNQRYGHTISPKTGRPVRSKLVSVTIIAPTATEADAYATACMAMGEQKAKEMIEKLNLAALFILENSSTWESPAFKSIRHHK